MNGFEWYNCDETSTGTDEHRRRFLDEVLKALI